MIKSITVLLKLLESILLAAGFLVLIYLYMLGGTPLLVAGAVPVYAVFGAFYLLIGLILRNIILAIRERRKRIEQSRRMALQAKIDAHNYADIQPGTSWFETRFANSVSR